MSNILKKITAKAKQLRRHHKTMSWRSALKEAGRKFRGTTVSGRKRQRRKKVAGVTTRSKTHIDKNKITANIQVGSIGHHKKAIRDKIKENIKSLVVTRFFSTKKSDRKYYSKRIAELKRQLKMYE